MGPLSVLMVAHVQTHGRVSQPPPYHYYRVYFAWFLPLSPMPNHGFLKIFGLHKFFDWLIIESGSVKLQSQKRT